MWHFLDLTQDQKLERRRLLDLYGSIAQISALIPLLILQIYFLALWLYRRWSDRDGKISGGIPGSPYLKKRRDGMVGGFWSRVRVGWRKSLWWMGDGVEVLGFKSTKGEIVGAGLWTFWLLVLCCLQTRGGELISRCFRSCF